MRADTAATHALADTVVGALDARACPRVGADAALGEVVDAMHAHRRGAVLVEDDGALVGIFTERDLLGRVDHGDPGWPARRVREVMTRQPLVVRADDTLADALRRMLETRRRHLPIVDAAGRALGLLSIRDLLAHVAVRFPDELINLPPDPTHET